MRYLLLENRLVPKGSRLKGSRAEGDTHLCGAIGSHPSSDSPAPIPGSPGPCFPRQAQDLAEHIQDREEQIQEAKGHRVGKSRPARPGPQSVWAGEYSLPPIVVFNWIF